MEKKEKKVSPKGAQAEELRIVIPKERLELLKRAAKLEGCSPEELLGMFAENKAHSYEENSISCEDCGLKIKEGERYFIREASFCTYEKQRDRIVENKDDSWTEECLCENCKEKKDSQKESLTKSFVKDHKREGSPLVGGIEDK